MLRALLGEGPRKNEGCLHGAISAMIQASLKWQEQMKYNYDPKHWYRQLYVWTLGLISSLDELEESYYAAAHFRKKVSSASFEDMTPAEKGNYARYVYFYKSGFIRVFSILDKTGNILQKTYEAHHLSTKIHHSFFVVLRTLHYAQENTQLTSQLMEIKERYKDPLKRLRKRRNTEIHYMNIEMQDDLMQLHQSLGGKLHLEDVDQYLDDLRLGLEMVCLILTAVFTHLQKRCN